MTLAEKNDCCNGTANSEDHICKKKIESHPAFGFKAGLIRVIGNLVYRNQNNQNIVSLVLLTSR